MEHTKKQSSVQWLVKQFNEKTSRIANIIGVEKYNSIIEQAKAMHREEIIDSYCQGCLDMTNDDTIFPRETSEQYYKETFGGQDNEN